MEEIDLRDLLGFYLKKIHIVALSVLILFIVGVLYTFIFKTPMYKSNTSLILVNSKQETVITQSDITLSEDLVTTYTEVIKSKKVLRNVIKELKLDYSIEELSDMITVTNVTDTEIIGIEVSSSNKDETKDIANKTAEVFMEEISKIYNLENVSIIDAAEDPDGPYNNNPVKDIVIASAIGFILSVAVLFVFYYFDNTVSSKEEIEKLLGVPVLGSIPLVKNIGGVK